MSRTVFADTSFWIALLDARDTHHGQARAGFFGPLRECRVVLSDFILFETITYLSCSVKRHDLAVNLLDRVERTRIELLTVDESTKGRSLEMFRRYSDKALSFTDCTSFVLMEVSRIEEYAGFDSHFAQMGFRPVVEGWAQGA